MENLSAVMEEVKQSLSKRTIDELGQAIAHGDRDKALALHEKNVEGKKGFHDFAVRWVNLTLKYLHQYGGDEGVLECMKEYAKTFYPPAIKAWIQGYEEGKLGPEDFPFSDFLRNRATLWQMVHDNLQDWEEDEDTITFTLDPCNSGGFLVAEHAEEVVKTEKAHTWTYGRQIQCYCLNCTTMWEHGWYQWFGWPLFIMEVPEVGSQGKCTMIMYKDPKKIPDEYYETRGLGRKI